MATPAFFGPEIHVNTTTASDQDTPSVTALANGKFVVVWEDFSRTGDDQSGNAVRGQLYNADGSPAGGEFLVNQSTANGQDDAVVTALTDGRFVVAWRDASRSGDDTSGDAIRARIFNVDGTPAGDEFLVNTTINNNQSDPAIAALSGGGFVVTWRHDFSATDIDIRARAYDSTGKALGDDVGVDTNGGNDETQSAVVGLANGNYAVVWQDEGANGGTDGSNSHIRAAIFSGNGTGEVSQFIVNTTTLDNQREPSIALLSDGNFIVAWTSDTPGDNSSIRGRLFSPTGVPLGPDFVVEADAEQEFESSVSALANGAYVVAWQNGEGGAETDGSSTHIRGQLYTGPGGSEISDEFVINATTNGSQVQASLSTLADGRVVATWTDAGGNAGDEGNAIRAQIFDPRTERVEIFGTSLSDDFVGTRFNDFFDGAGGDDRIDGAGGDDRIKGGAGADTIIGGDGNDEASYNDSAGSVTVNLATSTGTDGDALGDILSGIENLEGSSHGDELTGDAADNVLDGLGGFDFLEGGDGSDLLEGGLDGDFLFGGGGNDLLEGGEGTDELTGGDGIDTASYANSDGGVTVSLGAGNIAGIGGDAQGDILASIENLIGSDFADTLTGNSLANLLDGGLGADEMAGGGGNDTYIVDNAVDTLDEASGGGNDRVLSSISFKLGVNVENLELIGPAKINGAGNDLANTLTGNASANILSGGGGNDKLDGGAGLDTMRGGKGNDTYRADSSKDAVIEASGQGFDKVISSASFKLAANVENLALTGAAKINGTGNTLANVITGNANANILNGAGGNDTLNGGLGNDKLSGGLGNDKLNGGAGKDLLVGGAGNDAFVFNTALSAQTNVDKITGFSVANDTIQLDDAIFKAIGKALTADEFHIGAKAADSQDHLIYNKATGNLFYDANGSGPGGSTLFANAGAGLGLTHQDFLIV